MRARSLDFFFLILFANCMVTYGQELPAETNVKTYCIEGTTFDSSTNTAIALASVEINAEDNIPGSLFTKTNGTGYFKICSKEPIKNIRISLIGYEDKTIANYNILDTFKKLDKIILKTSAASMQGAAAKVKKDAETISIEKKTYSVSQNILATGGTAIDALKQIPAVNVDNDGNISLRGSNNITVYINGKLSSLSGTDRQALLQQIPAANIESIEVNTNPGAKQDAEGQSGIINITLKHNSSQNKNGYITLGAGTHNKYNGTFSFNTSYKKFSFGNTLSLRQNDLWGRGYNLRTNYLNGTSNNINQFSTGSYLTYNGAFSGNIDYNYSKKLTFSTNYMVSRFKNDDQDFNRNELSTQKDSIYQVISRNSFFKGLSDNFDGGISMRKTFNKPGHYLIAMTNYSTTKYGTHTDLVQNELSTLDDRIKSTNPYLLYSANDNHFTNKLLQLDYTRPMPKDIKLETGLKYGGRHLDNNFIVDSFSHLNQAKESDKGKSNHFIYEEKVSAAYLMVTHTVNSLFKYNAGLRLERTDIAGSQLSSNEHFAYNYTNLFPSGNINLTLQKKYNLPDLQMSYSKRINRPGQGQLNPFINFTDPYNLSRGNPNLKPELTNSVELSAIYNAKKMVYTATFYARQTDHPISRYRVIDSNGISMVTQINVGYTRSTGGEVIVRFSPLKDLKVTLNGNLYKYIVAGNVTGNDFINTRIAYSGKANLNYQFWKKTDVQASFSYMGPNVTPQGLIKPMYGLEIGGKKDLLKDKLSLSLNLADVFNNRRFAMSMTDPTFTSKFYRKRESMILTVNLTWKFGATDKAIEKKPRPSERPADLDF